MLFSPLHVLGESFAAAAISSLDVFGVVAPAANVNGLVVRRFVARGTAASGVLFFDTAVPSSNADVTKRAVIGQDANGLCFLPGPILLPAGVGVYWATGGAGAHTYCLNYDLR